MWGGVFGLRYVENERWGGLTLTLLLATFGSGFAFPLSILLALRRRSDMPLVRWLSIAYIELIRGVPLISVLFAWHGHATFPARRSIHRQVAAGAARHDSLPPPISPKSCAGTPGHTAPTVEAAQALGHSYWQRTWYVIVCPSAADCDPALCQYVYRLFKDTSLVVIIGLFDFRRPSRFPLRAGLERLRRWLIRLQPLVTSSSVIRCRVTVEVLSGIPRPANSHHFRKLKRGSGHDQFRECPAKTKPPSKYR